MHDRIFTVHKYQGSQSQKIFIVRLNNSPSAVIFTKSEYAVVAISRHTNSLVYYSVINDNSDFLVPLINRAETLNDDEIRSYVVNGPYGHNKSDYHGHTNMLVRRSYNGVPATTHRVKYVNGKFYPKSIPDDVDVVIDGQCLFNTNVETVEYRCLRQYGPDRKYYIITDKFFSDQLVSDIFFANGYIDNSTNDSPIKFVDDVFNHDHKITTISTPHYRIIPI